MSRADAVAVGDGGQALDVHAQQPGEEFGLDLAELRELLGDVGDRAVVLTQLLTKRRRLHRRDVAVSCQGSGQGLRRREFRIGRREAVGVAGLDLGRPRRREALHSRRTSFGGQEFQRGDGQLVVSGIELAPAGIGQRKRPGGPAATSGTVDPLLPSDEEPAFQQHVQVPADRRGSQPDPLGQRGSRRRSVLEDRLVHSLPSRGVGVDARLSGGYRYGPGVFHNTSVLLFAGALQAREA